MKHILAILLLLTVNSISLAKYPLTNVEIIDGDTINADINLPWSITIRDQRIRASDYDAYETSKRRQSVQVTDEEVVKGKEAKQALIELSKKKMYIEPDNTTTFRDNYGRILGIIYYEEDGKMLKLSEYMRKNNYLRN